MSSQVMTLDFWLLIQNKYPSCSWWSLSCVTVDGHKQSFSLLVHQSQLNKGSPPSDQQVVQLSEEAEISLWMSFNWICGFRLGGLQRWDLSRCSSPAPPLILPPSVYLYFCLAKKFKKVVGKETYTETLESTPSLEKEKFPQDYFPEVGNVMSSLQWLMMGTRAAGTGIDG